MLTLGQKPWAAGLLLVALVAAAHAARPGGLTALNVADADTQAIHAPIVEDLCGKDSDDEKHPYSSPLGLFIQERASKQLPGPGQHFSFGALVPWDKVHGVLDATPDSKLVLMVRHGQAVSNYLSDKLGPDIWFTLESQCSYTDDNDTFWGIFDADLTDLGKAEASALNSMLKDGGWFDKLTNGQPTRAIVSPLSRCLETSLLTLDGLNITQFHVDENIRETLGEDTCDARRALSDPRDGDPDHLIGPCQFTLGLRTKFPEFDFPISPPPAEPAHRGGKGGYRPHHRASFGLMSDADPMWTPERESQAHQTKRALDFLDDMFALVPERVVFVVTHSGTARSILLAVGREPYRPQNTELVPLIVQRKKPEPSGAGRDAL